MMWGKSLSIDLYGCQKETISSMDSVRHFIETIIIEIGMVAHGPCYIERFGTGNLNGISAMQFIETSSITVHCDEEENRVFVDIFSCKDFDEKDAVRVSLDYFDAHEAVPHSLIRG
jgi:S-adenosylmethionine decarboxylase